jgi:hypothetical protein
VADAEVDGHAGEGDAGLPSEAGPDAADASTGAGGHTGLVGVAGGVVATSASYRLLITTGAEPRRQHDSLVCQLPDPRRRRRCDAREMNCA